MAMSNLYSKISTKPVNKRSESMSVTQTNAWMNGKNTNGDNHHTSLVIDLLRPPGTYELPWE